MNLLHTIGLMTRAEHERLMDAYRDDWKMVCARSATDLAAQAEEIAAQKGLVAALTEKNVELVGRIETLKGYHRRDTEEIADLRPDAEAMRKKRAADRKRMAGKRNG